MIDELRERVAACSEMEARLQELLDEVRAAGAAALEELTAAAKADMNLRPLGATGGPPAGFRHGHISLEMVRDAVVKLRHFVIGELAAELGCSTARARRELDRVTDLVRPAGNFGQRQIWAYIPPEGPGAAFEQQQKLRVADPEVDVARVQATSQNIAQTNLPMISDKEIKKVVRKALDDGWRLVHVGGKHPLALVKDGCEPITLSSTPRNSGDAARAIARALRAA